MCIRDSYGYLDFIAWDLLAVLDAARAFFADTDLTWSGFHVFRRDVGAVRLWEQEKEPEVDPETGSLLSMQNIETLESFQDEISGYFGQMLCWLEDFIEQGVQEGKFTQRQAHQDLQIALWYSFACNTLDEYRYCLLYTSCMLNNRRKIFLFANLSRNMCTSRISRSAGSVKPVFVTILRRNNAVGCH